MHTTSPTVSSGPPAASHTRRTAAGVKADRRSPEGPGLDTGEDRRTLKQAGTNQTPTQITCIMQMIGRSTHDDGSSARAPEPAGDKTVESVLCGYRHCSYPHEDRDTSHDDRDRPRWTLPSTYPPRPRARRPVSWSRTSRAHTPSWRGPATCSTRPSRCTTSTSGCSPCGSGSIPGRDARVGRHDPRSRGPAGRRDRTRSGSTSRSSRTRSGGTSRRPVG